MSDGAEAVAKPELTDLHVEPVRPDFAAIINNIDLTAPLSPAARNAIVEALDSYAVVIFRGQPLSAQQLVAFGEQFGPLDRGLQQKLMSKMQDRLGLDSVTDVSNVDLSGNTAGRSHVQTVMTVGNRFWHSDSAYAHTPFRYSFLAAVTAASWGGATEFADLRAAYDSLDDRTRKLISDKEAIFFAQFTRQMLGIEDPVSSLAAYPPTRWPMVRVHPGSGRKLIWCDSKVCEVVGMPVPEGRALVHDLIEHIGQREHVYAHAWQAGDVVIYDNRSVLHRGRTFDLNERREMRRVATIDDACSLGEGKPSSPVILQSVPAALDRADPASFADGNGSV